MYRFKQDRSVVQMIAKHMAPRLGESVYQVAGFSTPPPF